MVERSGRQRLRYPWVCLFFAPLCPFTCAPSPRNILERPLIAEVDHSIDHRDRRDLGGSRDFGDFGERRERGGRGGRT